MHILPDKKHPYYNKTCVFTTKHHKATVFKEPLRSQVGCILKELPLDTDQLGTFYGDIPRLNSSLETCKRKCLLGLDAHHHSLGLANEGTFGIDSVLNIPYDAEVVILIDKDQGCELIMDYKSYDTNYSAATIQTEQELEAFAKQGLFPSHGLIVTSYPKSQTALHFKGIQNWRGLVSKFKACLADSQTRKVVVETDMRAHMNPTRMKVLSSFANIVTKRLSHLCPICKIPGWGVIATSPGLPCALCHAPTGMTKETTFGCIKCTYQKTIPKKKQTYADPGFCLLCNP